MLKYKIYKIIYFSLHLYTYIYIYIYIYISFPSLFRYSPSWIYIHEGEYLKRLVKLLLKFEVKFKAYQF